MFTGLSLRATQEGQYTDRYTKAVDQLGQQGPEKLQIRLGGIYALERLTRDSPRDQPTIIEVLSSFIRGNLVPVKDASNTCPIPPAVSVRPSPVDVQAALTVLGRRDSAHDNEIRIDLSNTCLTLVDLTHADLTGANLAGATLAGANLTDAKLGGAALGDANLAGADLGGANLTNAKLIGANLTGARLSNADLTKADLHKAKLIGARLVTTKANGTSLSNADLTKADLFKVDLTAAMLLDADLTGSDLTGATLTGATLAKANLSGANLTDTVHTPETDVDGAITNAETLGKWW